MIRQIKYILPRIFTYIICIEDANNMTYEQVYIILSLEVKGMGMQVYIYITFIISTSGGDDSPEVYLTYSDQKSFTLQKKNKNIDMA